MTSTFTLAVVASLDGFIARAPGHPPQDWASAEEQAIFFRQVEAADWAIMGRGTHEAADKPQRRRIVFSTSGGAGQWRRPTQLWLDPAGRTPRDLPALVERIHPMRQALILGGTTVHDWFLRHGAIDRIVLTIEPVRFGEGLPIFTGQTSEAPETIIRNAGFQQIAAETLNPAGTRLVTFQTA